MSLPRRLSSVLHRHREDAIALLGLALLPALVFSRALTGPEVFWQRDISFFWYPQVESFVSVVAGGAWPVWNPYFSFGLPLLADPSSQVLYPFTWANLVLPPALYYKVYVLCHVTLAGVGLFLLMRSWRFGRVPSFVSGAVWVLSGPLLVVVSHTHHLAGTTWLPWVVLALERALRSGTARAHFALGAVAAGQVVAGSGDLCLMSAFVALSYLLVYVAAGAPPVGDRVRRALSLAAISLPAAALLSAPQWVPTLAILRSGQRLHLDHGFNLAWSLHPASLIDLFVPRFVADLPLNELARAAVFDSREPLFACVYVGAGAAALVASAVALPWDRAARFCGIGFILSILAALGKHAVLYPALLDVTPLHLFRYPSKYVILAGFFWAALVGQRLEAWLRTSDPGRRPLRRRWWIGLCLAATFGGVLLLGSVELSREPRVLSRLLSVRSSEDGEIVARSAGKLAQAGAVAMVGATLAWLRSRRSRGGILSCAFVALMLADLFPVGRSVNSLAPPELLTARPALLAHMTPGARVWVASMGTTEGALESELRGPIEWRGGWSWVRGTNEMLRPPTGARWGMGGSYDGDFTGLASPLLSNMTLIIENAGKSPLAVRLLQMGGVGYVVSLDSWPLLAPVAEQSTAFLRPIRLYGVPGALPRAYVVGRARVRAEPESVEALADPTFDPAREVIVAPGAPALASVGAFEAAVRESWRRPDSIGLEVDSNGPAYAVALEPFSSGWRARLDGRPAQIVRADVLFQAVPIPGGKHSIVLEYRPASVVWGLALGAAGLVLAAVVLRASRGAP